VSLWRFDSAARPSKRADPLLQGALANEDALPKHGRLVVKQYLADLALALGWLLVIERHVVLLELLGGHKLLHLDSKHGPCHRLGFEHPKVGLDTDNLVHVLVVVVELLSLQHSAQHSLHQPRLLLTNPDLKLPLELEHPVLILNLVDTRFHLLFDEPTGLNAPVVLDQPAELPPIELDAPGPAHGLPLLLEVSSDRSLDQRGLPLNQVEYDPSLCDPLQGVLALQSLQDARGRLPHRGQAPVLLERSQAFQILLHPACLPVPHEMSPPVEALDLGHAAQEVPLHGQLLARRVALHYFLDLGGAPVPHLAYPADSPDVDPRVELDKVHLAQLHLIIGVAQHLEVAPLGQVAAEVLLNDD